MHANQFWWALLLWFQRLQTLQIDRIPGEREGGRKRKRVREEGRKRESERGRERGRDVYTLVYLYVLSNKHVIKSNALYSVYMYVCSQCLYMFTKLKAKKL